MKNRLNLIKLLLLFTFLISLQTGLLAQQVLEGTATRVYDGDTFTLVTETGDEYKIRIVGIDAPERQQKFGIESRDYARDLINGKQVSVYSESKDRYNRILSIVITEEGDHFNYEMVLNGYAWHYATYSNDSFLEAAQKEAKRSRKGLWADDAPQEPWKWRRDNR